MDALTKDMTKDLTIEQIPDSLYRQIAETIGIINLIALTDLIGGTTFYLPKPDSFTRPVRDARIREEFNGYNHVELARKYNISERWVRDLCGEGQPEGQVSLFDLEEPA